MPYISMFFGIIIRMFYNDHPPSHFHAEYQGQRGIFDFDGNMTQGNLTSRTAQRLIREWASQHREELGACRREKAMAHYKALRLVHSRPFASKHHLSAFESVLVREACLSVGYRNSRHAYPMRKVCRRFTLKAIHTRHHAPAAAHKPRSEHGRKPQMSLIRPSTGSTVHVRQREIAPPISVWSL